MTPEQRGITLSRIASLVIWLTGMAGLMITSTAATVFEVPLWIPGLICCLPWLMVAGLWFVVLPVRQRATPPDADEPGTDST